MFLDDFQNDLAGDVEHRHSWHGDALHFAASSSIARVIENLTAGMWSIQLDPILNGGQMTLSKLLQFWPVPKVSQAAIESLPRLSEAGIVVFYVVCAGTAKETRQFKFVLAGNVCARFAIRRREFIAQEIAAYFAKIAAFATLQPQASCPMPK